MLDMKEIDVRNNIDGFSEFEIVHFSRQRFL